MYVSGSTYTNTRDEPERIVGEMVSIGTLTTFQLHYCVILTPYTFASGAGLRDFLKEASILADEGMTKDQ